MDIRASAAVAATLLLGGAACGLEPAAHVSVPAAAPASVTTAESPSAPAGVYRAASKREARIATRFVLAVCTYRATTEKRGDFTKRASEVATAGEVGRLRASGRARLDWPALRARHERVTVQVNGVTQVDAASHAVTVELIRTTATDFAVLHTYGQMNLTVLATPRGLKVYSAEGACL